MLREYLQVRMVEFLFEDIFRIDRLNPDGKKFDKGTYFLMLIALLLQPFSLFFSVAH